MQNYIHLFLTALAVTVVIETAVLAAVFFLRRRSELSQMLFTRIIIAGIIASSSTLPFVWFVFPGIIDNRTLFLVVAELFAFIAEIPIIKGIVKSTWLEALSASLIANSISFLSGFLIGLS